jgi:hypothetical protein
MCLMPHRNGCSSCLGQGMFVMSPYLREFTVFLSSYSRVLIISKFGSFMLLFFLLSCSCLFIKYQWMYILLIISPMLVAISTQLDGCLNYVILLDYLKANYFQCLIHILSYKILILDAYKSNFIAHIIRQT